MQLHPNEPGGSVKHCAESLSARYIGLDFEHDVGDLNRTPQSELPQHQKDYWAFAHSMVEGDYVLIIAHHFPVAIVRIAGPYNYIRQCAPEIGVWFRQLPEGR
ncbi:MAG TPA: hypothetical protein VHL34_09690 [Rhizomicrobium sp.]|jgi:hypothetical protein|nr:hypothetical protein [Rhizomicrobium sp.]